MLPSADAHPKIHSVDGVGALNCATNPSYPNTELRMSRIKTRTRPSVSGSTVTKTHPSNQNKQVNPLFVRACPRLGAYAMSRYLWSSDVSTRGHSRGMGPC